MTRMCLCPSDLKYVLLGLYRRIPDVGLYLSRLQKEELDYARDLFREKKYTELEKFVNMTDHLMAGHYQGYIQLCLAPDFPSLYKPLSKTYLQNHVSIIRLLQKNEAKAQYPLAKLNNLPAIGFESYVWNSLVPDFLSGNMNLIDNRELYTPYAFGDNFKAWIGLREMMKNKTT